MTCEPAWRRTQLPRLPSSRNELGRGPDGIRETVERNSREFHRRPAGVSASRISPDTVNRMDTGPLPQPAGTYLSTSLARDIARRAHDGQVDKAGVPYIQHPARVAARLEQAYGAQHPVVAVGWLHDVLEDTGISADDLVGYGASPDQVHALVALTHHKHEPYLDSLGRVVLSPMALVTKLADIADNTSGSRTASLEPEARMRLRTKYAKGLAFLEAHLGHIGVRLDSPDLLVMVEWNLVQAELLVLVDTGQQGDLGELLAITQLLQRTGRQVPIAIAVRIPHPLMGGRSLLEFVAEEGTRPALRAWRQIGPALRTAIDPATTDPAASGPAADNSLADVA